MEALRRLARQVLGRTRLYSLASRSADFVAVVTQDGIRTWRLLQELRRGVFKDAQRVRFRSLTHPLLVRPGVDDNVTVINTIVRHEWGDFSTDQPPQWILDAGAYIGDSAAYFLSRFPSARVVALEPGAASHDMAAANLAPYGERATLLKAGLWGTDGSARLAGESTGASVGAEGVEIQTVTIPTLMRQFGLQQIDILKMDIEGAELSVLQSEAAEWLPRVGLLILEIHGAAIEAGVRPILERFGFSMRRHRSVWYCTPTMRDDARVLGTAKR